MTAQSVTTLRVTLLDTTNQLVRSRLPLVGDLHVIEVGDDGSITAATFRPADGSMGTTVEVPNPMFSYGLADDEPVTAADLYRAAADHLANAELVHAAQQRGLLPSAGWKERDRDKDSLVERHLRFAELRLALAKVRTDAAMLVTTRPPLGQRKGSSVEHGAWNTELARNHPE